MKTERFNIQLPKDLQEEAKKVAKENGYTFSGFVAEAIKYKLHSFRSTGFESDTIRHEMNKKDLTV